MNLAQTMKRLEKFTIDNSPAILTAIGITGTLTTAYLTGKATIKATRLIDEELERVNYGRRDPELLPTPRDIVLYTWKLYIPAIVTGTLTVAAIFGANRVSTRRATAVATAYSITERAFAEYKDKVVQKVGEKKEQTYRDEIAQERVTKNPPDSLVVMTDGGDVLCYDQFTGRYFRSTMEDLKQAENTINHQILHDGYASLTDLYSELGLKPTSFSDEVGWTIDYLLKMNFSTTLSEDNKPCLAIDFDLRPSRNFSHFAR